MEINDLSVNQDVEIEVKQGPYKGSYSTRIADIHEDTIDILTPYKDGALVPLRQGLEVSIFFAGESAAFKFSAEIIGRAQEPVPIIRVRKPENDEMVKIQRRQHFRLEVRKKVWYRLVNEDWEPVDEEEFKETHTMDISAGGLKILIPLYVELNEGEIKVDIEDIEGVPIISEVANYYSMPDLPDKNAVGIKFLDINRRTRDALMGWLFEYQRKLRRKGLL